MKENTKAKEFISKLIYENPVVASQHYRTGPVDSVPAFDDIDVNIYDLANTKVWGRVDSFVRSMSDSTYRELENPVNVLRQKLQYVGLTLPMFHVEPDTNYLICLDRFGSHDRVEDAVVVKGVDSVAHVDTGATGQAAPDNVQETMETYLYLSCKAQVDGRHSIVAHLVRSEDTEELVNSHDEDLVIIDNDNVIWQDAPEVAVQQESKTAT